MTRSSLAQILIIASAIGLALFLFGRFALPRLLEWHGVHLTRHTRFGMALVFDSTDADGTPIRLLNVGGTFQSVSYVSDALWCELVCAYHRTFAQVLEMAPAVHAAAVLGGGGYSFPKYLLTHDPKVQVSVVEIDPAVTDLARRYFFLDRLEALPDVAGRLDLVCDDAWAWLRAHDEPLDLIVNDAFSGGRPLGALACDEGAHLIHGHLSPEGIYLANVRSKLEGHASHVLVDTADAFAREFAHVYVFPERADEPGKINNNALVACDIELPCNGAWTGAIDLAEWQDQA